MSPFNNDFNSDEQLQTAMFADCLANSKEIFHLIDTVFPIDSCRHYQVLPIQLQGSNLTLGMLDPRNEESLKFVNSIAKVFKYQLNLKLIDLATHQIILANYPQNFQHPAKAQRIDENKTVIESEPAPTPINSRRLQDSAPTIITTDENKTVIESELGSTPINSRRLQDSAPTIITTEEVSVNQPQQKLPDLPADLDFLRDLDLTPHPSGKRNQDATPTVYEIPQEATRPQSRNFNLDDKPTVIGGDPAQLLAQETSQPEQVLDLLAIINEVEENQEEVIIELEPQTKDFLPELLPQLSWHKLLEQTFKYHTEQLQLTRYSDRGSIFAYRNQVVQSSLDQIPLPLFCSLIDEIKRMSRVSGEITAQPHKVVIERFYELERILLRLEFKLQNQQEKVIIQILRAESLKDYEQQQLNKIGEQALHLAQQLEKTLRRINACFDSGKLNNLRELQTVQTRINQQLKLLDK
ncbi:hypothetical protein NIES4102_21960 [Chondrocystis sp. NIES-4102]|nr:hypothetical protein NIES4102_21960 [Chondrocystis sp. NIES-4102]